MVLVGLYSNYREEAFFRSGRPYYCPSVVALTYDRLEAKSTLQLLDREPTVPGYPKDAAPQLIPLVLHHLVDTWHCESIGRGNGPQEYSDATDASVDPTDRLSQCGDVWMEREGICPGSGIL